MQIGITKKLAEKMKLEKFPQMTEAGSIYTWRANISQSGRQRILVFMNDASRYVLVVQSPKVKTFQNLSEVFTETLRGALYMEQVNPTVIDSYIDGLGSVTYVANSGKKETAWLNTACNNAWYSTNKYKDNICQSVFTSHMNIGSNDNDTRAKPSKVFMEALSNFGQPVKKCTAFDLTIRLKLSGNDAVRVIRVPANLTFSQLHIIIQQVYNWRDYHYSRFSFFENDDYDIFAEPIAELIIDNGESEFRPEARIMHDVRLADYLPKWKKCIYYYDYGDGWEHHIEVAKIIEDYTSSEDLPQILFDSGDAPPEDVGGPGEFEEFLEIIENPQHEEHGFMEEWAKEQWWKRFDFEKKARSLKSALWW